MTQVATELDFSVLEELDFNPSCGIPNHGHNGICKGGDAEWLAQQVHACDPKTVPVCNDFKEFAEGVMADEGETLPCPICNETILYEDYLKIVGRI